MHNLSPQLGNYDTLGDTRRGRQAVPPAVPSPDLNPAGQVSAKLKGLVCRAARRTVDAT